MQLPVLQGRGAGVFPEAGEGARRRPARPPSPPEAPPVRPRSPTTRPGGRGRPTPQTTGGPRRAGASVATVGRATPHPRAARPNSPRPVLVKRDCVPLVRVSLSRARIKSRCGGLAARVGPVVPGGHRVDQLLAAHRSAFLGQHLGRRVQGAELAGRRRGVGRVHLRLPVLAAPVRPGRRLRGRRSPARLRRRRALPGAGSGAYAAAWTGGRASCLSLTASAPGTSEPAPSCCAVWAPAVSAAVPSTLPISTTAAGGPPAAAVSATAPRSFGAFLRFAAGIELLPLFFAMMLIPSIRVVHVGVARRDAATGQDSYLAGRDGIKLIPLGFMAVYFVARKPRRGRRRRRQRAGRAPRGGRRAGSIPTAAAAAASPPSRRSAAGRAG